MHNSIDEGRAEILRPGLEAHDTRSLLEMNDGLQRELEPFREEWLAWHAGQQIGEVINELDVHGPTYLLDELGDGPPEPRDPNANLLAVAPLAALLKELFQDLRDEREANRELSLGPREGDAEAPPHPQRMAEARLSIALDLLYRGVRSLQDRDDNAEALLSEDALSEAEFTLQRIVDADLHPPSRRRMLRLLQRFPAVYERVDFDEPDEDDPWEELESSRDHIIQGLLIADSLMSTIEADPPPGGADSIRRIWDRHHPSSKARTAAFLANVGLKSVKT